MQVVVDSLMTTYSREGKGGVVLILHGWGDSSKSFQKLSHALSSNYDVICVDLPGFGGSQAPTAAWGLTDYAIFLQHFLAKIGVHDVWAIIGHSNGGAIAIRGLGMQLLQSERLVLLASAGIRNVYKGRNRALRIIAKAGKAAAMPLPQSIKKKLRRKLYTTVGSDMLVAEHLQETFKKVVTDDVREDTQHIRIPVLLVYGERDAATPLWYGEQYRELFAHATLEVLPGVEHFVHIERSAEVERAIQEFMHA